VASEARRTETSGPCRYCGTPSYLADELGPVHECCKAWRRVIKAGHPCPACQVAGPVLKQMAAQQAQGKQVSEMRIRLPRLPALPLLTPDGSPFVPEIKARDPGPRK
jgi:hypothetical protein